MDEGAMPIGDGSLFSQKFRTFVLVSDEAQLSRFQIFDIGPYHFIDRCFSLSIFGLVEELVADSSGGSSAG